MAIPKATPHLVSQHMNQSPSPEFTPEEREILRMVQGTLPDSKAPFAMIAERLGLDEDTVLDFLNRLKNRGLIRRFGATLRHQEAGYDCNVMVAWLVENEQDMDRVSTVMRNRPEITHCYQRRTCPEWPFNLYTMVHGKSSEQCRRIVDELQQETGISRYELLFSDKELKKTSMVYF
jgi:DNA-binding Lrp family transcriptional regulator